MSITEPLTHNALFDIKFWRNLRGLLATYALIIGASEMGFPKRYRQSCKHDLRVKNKAGGNGGQSAYLKTNRP